MPPPSTFTSLPAETRHQIYEEIVSLPHTICTGCTCTAAEKAFCGLEHPQLGPLSSLIRTSKLLRFEIHEYFGNMTESLRSRKGYILTRGLSVLSKYHTKLFCVRAWRGVVFHFPLPTWLLKDGQEVRLEEERCFHWILLNMVTSIDGARGSRFEPFEWLRGKWAGRL